MCAQDLSIHTSAAGAGTLGLPVGAFLILQPVHHTCYKRGEVVICAQINKPVGVCECILTFADRTAEMRIMDRIGAVDRRTLLFTADDIPTLQQTHQYINMQQLQCAFGTVTGLESY